MANDEETTEELDEIPETDDEGEGEGGGQPAAPVLAEDDVRGRLQEKETQVESLNAALRQERHRSRRTEKRVEQLIQVLSQRLAPPPAPAEPEIPSPEEDVIGHLLGQVDQRLKPLTAMVANQAEQAAEREVSEQANSVATFVHSDIARFEQEHPDYREAEKFVAGTMLRQIAERLRYSYPSADPDDIIEAAVGQLHDVAAQLHLQYFSSGKSIAQATYEIAIAHGWSPEAAAAAAQEAGGAQRTASGSPAIERARRRVSRPGLGGVSSGQPTKMPTKREVIDMEDDEFADFIERTGTDKNFRALAKHFAS